MTSDSYEPAPKLPVFLRVFFALFFFTFAVSVLVSYAMPKVYEATATVRGRLPAALEDYERFDQLFARAFEFAMSDKFWSEPAADANSGSGSALTSARERVAIHPSRGRHGIVISATARRPSACAVLTRSVTEALIQKIGEDEAMGALHLRAEYADPKLISPIKPRIIGRGVLIGIGLGALGGLGVVQLRRRIEARQGGRQIPR